MAEIDDLPADQRAVLQLLLKQGQTYEDISGVLNIDATAVRGILVPAAIALLGERAWYLPRWLAWLPGGRDRHAVTEATGVR